MIYLTDVTESYRADTEAEVNQLIEDAKHDSRYELTKYTRTAKEKKQKGEIIESWYKVTLSKRFCDEKDPHGNYEVSYEEA